MIVDPVLAWSLRVALSLLLGWAAWHKLRDVAAFAAAVENYRLLPPVWAVPAAAGLIAVECGLTVGLWLPGVAHVAALGTAALFGLYAAAMAAALRSGRRDVDCGCAGPAHRQSVRPALVARNVVLVAAALLAALPTGHRPLGGLDWLMMVMAPLVAGCLYAAIDGLLANGPRLAALARLRRPEAAGG